MTGRKMTAGNSTTFEPTNIDDMTNVKSLDYDKPYSEFNYDKYLNHFKQSNFVGGGKMRKVSNNVNNMIKKLYIEYKNGLKSSMKKVKKGKKVKSMKPMKMRGGEGESEMFLATIKEMKDVSHLDYKEPYEYSKIPTVSSIPRSNFQALGNI
jgi:hypothetical protein